MSTQTKFAQSKYLPNIAFVYKGIKYPELKLFRNYLPFLETNYSFRLTKLIDLYVYIHHVMHVNKTENLQLVIEGLQQTLDPYLTIGAERVISSYEVVYKYTQRGNQVEIAAMYEGKAPAVYPTKEKKSTFNKIILKLRRKKPLSIKKGYELGKAYNSKTSVPNPDFIYMGVRTE